MSTVEPIEEGTTQPKRNKETTRGTIDCLQWANGEGIRQYVVQTPRVKSRWEILLYFMCNLVVIKGAILIDHVLGKNKKQVDGSYAPASG